VRVALFALCSLLFALCSLYDVGMKVADMTVEELADLIRAIVAEELNAFRDDDDEREVRPEFLAEIEESIRNPGRWYSPDEVRKELGLSE
jgi:hypothetical protein